MQCWRALPKSEIRLAEARKKAEIRRPSRAQAPGEKRAPSTVDGGGSFGLRPSGFGFKILAVTHVFPAPSGAASSVASAHLNNMTFRRFLQPSRCVPGLLFTISLFLRAWCAEGPSPKIDQATAAAARRIDDRVFTRLKKLGIPPAPACSDAVFVRRVHLDVMGTLPTAAEAREFLRDTNAFKRALLIDRLLEHDAFADYWAMKWGDLLRVKAEFPINLWPNAAQAYHHWIRTCLKENVPYDRFARELLTASGSNARVPPVNFYRAGQGREPAALAQAVALTFLGERTSHWPSNRLAGLAAFFAQVGYKTTAEWKEEIVFFDPRLATNALTKAAAFPDGTRVVLPPDRDPRMVFADWLISPGNPWFARNIANRVWSWLLGRGIIHEPDDIRPDNPPSNPELLACLEQELAASGYDLKHLFRIILNSRAYQLASRPADDPPAATAHFASYPLRRLEAEVLIDALNDITNTREKYSSPIPEPFTFIPEEMRATALPDGSITSPFLEMFGRSPRDTGLETERNNRCTAAQRLHLLNSSHIQRKIEQSPLVRDNSQSRRPLPEMAANVYLGILSRFPTAEELRALQTHARAVPNRRDLVIDLAWALINSAEFAYRH